jgi:hypothetical protein
MNKPALHAFFSRPIPGHLRQFLPKALPILLLLLAAERYIGQRFLIGGDDQLDRCLPDKWVYLIDTHNKDIWRGDLMAFRAERMTPFFKDGQIIVKIAAGVTGDTIHVDAQHTKINCQKLRFALLGLCLRPSSDWASLCFVLSEFIRLGFNRGPVFYVGSVHRLFRQRMLGWNVLKRLFKHSKNNTNLIG